MAVFRALRPLARRRGACVGAGVLFSWMAAAQAHGEQPGASAPASEATAQSSTPPEATEPEDPKHAGLKVRGLVELFYQYNFNRPPNGISAYRAADPRHNSISLANATIDAGWDSNGVSARIALQFGHTAYALYAEEPQHEGAETVAESGPSAWRNVQRAVLGWKAPIGSGLQLEAGIFPNTAGYETLAVKDNWNWSRSTIFLVVPYQTGLRAEYDPADGITLLAGVYNGWSNVTDNNRSKTVHGQASFKGGDRFTASVSYLGGNERPSGAPEASAWRHTADAWMQLDATDSMSFALEGLGGFERNAFGTHRFGGGAVYGRLKTSPWLYLAARGDGFWERPSENRLGKAEPIAMDARSLVSGTATLDVRPSEGLSVRFEYRQDRASGKLFYGRSALSGTSPSARSQRTVLVGATAWF
jgi:hypothetical protein